MSWLIWLFWLWEHPLRCMTLAFRISSLEVSAWVFPWWTDIWIMLRSDTEYTEIILTLRPINVWLSVDIELAIWMSHWSYRHPRYSHISNSISVVNSIKMLQYYLVQNTLCDQLSYLITAHIPRAHHEDEHNSCRWWEWNQQWRKTLSDFWEVQKVG